MEWKKVSLAIVAPCRSSAHHLNPKTVVWHLSLDQIEGNTGIIVNKQLAPAEEAGVSTYVFDEQNVLYSKLRPYLNKVICPQEIGIATTELVPLFPRSAILDKKYLLYYLRSNLFLNFTAQNISGARMPRVDMTAFWKHQIPLPPLSEQRRIVEILDRADALRRKRARADAVAERVLPALFIKMFGDPATNPMGWEVKLLSELSEVQGGLQLSSKRLEFEQKVPYLRVANVYRNELDLSEIKYLRVTPDEFEKVKLETGDVLIVEGHGNSNEIGRCAVWDGTIPGCVHQNHLIRVRTYPNKLNNEYLSRYINISKGRQYFTQLSRTTSGLNTISTNIVRNLPVILPPLSLQQQYAQQVQRYRQLLKKQASSRNRIDTLFQLLLHRAFSGELTARWREQHMSELLVEMEQQAQVLRNGNQQEHTL